jgi:hypothetical protein
MPTQTKSSPSGQVDGIESEITLNFASMATLTGDTQTASVPGAAVNDVVSISPRAALEAGIVIAFARVSAADTVQVRAHNASAGTVDPASVVCDVFIQKPGRG